jgi:hypothetical protein
MKGLEEKKFGSSYRIILLPTNLLTQRVLEGEF